MVIIKFKDGSDWYKANWVFRQLAEDTILAFPNDNDLKFIMEQAQAFGALPFYSMESDAANSTMKAIKEVAEQTIEGKIQGMNRTRPWDKDGQRMYLESIQELLCLLEKQTGNEL